MRYTVVITDRSSGVFINNAGHGPDPAFLHEHTAAEVDGVIAINCAALTKATHAVLPCMLVRGRGAIVSISSIAGTFEAMPYDARYGASKAFVDHFSRSLSEEYGSQGIDIQVPMSLPPHTAVQQRTLSCENP